MPIRRFLVGLGLAAALASGAPAAAETAWFDVSIAGIRAGELALSAERNGSSYEAGGRARATGLLGAVARLGFDGVARGRVARDGSLVPEHYSARSRSPCAERDTVIRFDNGSPVSVSVEPPRRHQVDLSAQTGAVDPISAAYVLMLDTRAESICNTRMNLFDGSRRSEVLVGRAQAQGDLFVCNGQYSRLEGDDHSVWQPDWTFRLVYRQTGGGNVALERIETPTRFGKAVLTRRS
jgi:hypothetical protein